MRKVDPAGIITTVVGGGPATAARLNSASAVCINRAGNLWSESIRTCEYGSRVHGPEG